MQYKVMFSCGHEDTVNIIGKMSERERMLKWYEHSAVCPKCYKEKREQEKKLHEEQKEIAKNEFNLPKLEGSEKQIAWANNLRLRFIASHLQSVRAAQNVIDNNLNDESIVAYMKVKRDYSVITESEIESKRKTILENMSDIASFAVLTTTSAKWCIENLQ